VRSALLHFPDDFTARDTDTARDTEETR
jgi:hypothetical protein